MNKELSIIIAGQVNSGKSTLMLEIEKALKEKGYDVQLSFKGHPDYSGENTFHFHNKEEQFFEEKTEKIKANTKIILREAQLKTLPINMF
jgi:AAA+ ATPase superfamily predicted ATPase